MSSKKLTDTNISDTYPGVLHARGKSLNQDGTVERVYDGTGTRSSLSIGTDGIEVDGSANFKGSTPGAGVRISANDGSIEIADNAGSDNPYIDFKTHLTAEDYDCRIIKVNNGLEFITGGSGTTSSNLEIYSNGRTRIGSGDRAPVSTLSITNGGIAITSNGDGDWGFIDQGPTNSGIGFRGQGSSTTSDLDLFVAHGGNVGIGTMAPQKKLHIVGQMRYEHGTPVPGQVLTCKSVDGNAAWEDSGGDTMPFGDFRSKGTWHQNTRSRKIMVIIILDGGNDIYGYRAYIGPDNPNQLVAFEYHVSDGYAKDATTMNIIVPPGWYFRHDGDASVVKAQAWEI